MNITTKGIHHITAIVKDPQSNLHFYEDILGLRLVKKTINFDDPGVYHLYFGDKVGSPGTILTFFPIPMAARGRIGSGQVDRTLFNIPKGSSVYWKNYLEDHGVEVEENEAGLWFTDPEGLQLGLVENDNVETEYWNDSTIEEENAIQGFYGAILNTLAPYKTKGLLESMGFTEEEISDSFIKLKSSHSVGNHVWIRTTATPRGIGGAGTVHHIAFRTEKESDQKVWQAELQKEELRVTPVMDRQYFKSVYFHEHGGILFEIATDEPGFSFDEDVEKLGKQLKLPHWLEDRRDDIEAKLPNLKRGE